MYRAVTTILILAVSAITAMARITFDKPSVLFSGIQDSHVHNLRNDFDISVVFMQNEWLGLGTSIGSATSRNFVRMNGKEDLDILQDTIEYESVHLKISALISPKIFRIKKFTMYAELWPYVGVSGSRFNLTYGYMDSQGTPKIGQYSGLPLFIGSKAGLGIKIGKYFYISYGFEVSTGNGGKLEVKYGGKGKPDFKQRMMHGTYLCIGFRL